MVRVFARLVSLARGTLRCVWGVCGGTCIASVPYLLFLTEEGFHRSALPPPPPSEAARSDLCLLSNTSTNVFPGCKEAGLTRIKPRSEKVSGFQVVPLLFLKIRLGLSGKSKMNMAVIFLGIFGYLSIF